MRSSWILGWVFATLVASPATAQGARVAVVVLGTEDAAMVREPLIGALRGRGYEPVSADSVEGAIAFRLSGEALDESTAPRIREAVGADALFLVQIRSGEEGQRLYAITRVGEAGAESRFGQTDDGALIDQVVVAGLALEARAEAASAAAAAPASPAPVSPAAAPPAAAPPAAASPAAASPAAASPAAASPAAASAAETSAQHPAATASAAQPATQESASAQAPAAPDPARAEGEDDWGDVYWWWGLFLGSYTLGGVFGMAFCADSFCSDGGSAAWIPFAGPMIVGIDQPVTEAEQAGLFFTSIMSGAAFMAAVGTMIMKGEGGGGGSAATTLVVPWATAEGGGLELAGRF
ncbi:MAG: hypothetical protein SangKO_027910 [Sandaracinaceae bacterium]